MATPATPAHVDVLIIGAGLSGIGAAAQVLQHLPGKSVAILESREASGGTWDLFRYPGIRSDSDMFTFGYKWHPWPSDQSLADGRLILDYLRTVAHEHGVEEHIRYQHTVTAADWDSETARWTVTVDVAGETRTLTAGFLWCCAGYYDYEQGFQPHFPGLADYEGTFLHPQHWPEDLDYTGKRVLVIGSGATAVTLIPAMANSGAEHVTMLQRTPTYILSRPGKDVLATRLKGLPIPGFLPLKRLRKRSTYESVRWFNIMLAIVSYQLSRRAPGRMKKLIHDDVVGHLTARPGQPGFTKEEAESLVRQHFTPPYDPWDQRLCFVPDGDLWKAMREGKADVVTDRIRTFTAKGVELESGETIEADVVISATGLNIRLFGGIDYRVDGQPVDLADTMSYKALMLTGMPNFAYTIGYTNASWTLKADLVSEYVVKLLRYLDEHGHRSVTVKRDPSVGERPFMDLASGYIQRALETMPKQGDRFPWALRQNYLTDVKVIKGSRIDDGNVVFG